MKNRSFLLTLLAITTTATIASGQILDFPPAVPLQLHKPLDNETRMMQRTAAQLENRGEYQKALEIYLDLFDEYPEYLPFYEGVIRNFTSTSQYANGLAWVDSLKADLLSRARPQDLTFAEREKLGNLIVDGGRFCGLMNRREEAFKCWEELYSLPHTSSGPYFRLFSAMIETRYPDGLEDMAKRARKITGDPSLLASSLAGYWANRGQLDRAVEEWLRLMEVQPRQAENVKRMILGLPEDEVTSGQIEASLKAALPRKAIQLQVIELLGSLYFRNRQWEDAYEQVRLANQLGEGNGVALLLFVENLNAEGEYLLAIRILEDLDQSHPELTNQPRALLARARALEANQVYDQADSVYTLLTSDRYLRTMQGNEALILQAKLRLNVLKQPGAARRILEDGLKRHPQLRGRDEAALLIGDTYLAERNLTSARQAYLEVSQAHHGRSPEIQSRALINAAQVDIYLGEVDQAVERLKTASQSSPEGALTNDALDLLEMLRNGQADSVALRIFAQAELERKLGQTAAAESLFIQVAAHVQVGDLAERALCKLADLRRAAGRIDEALETLDEFMNRFTTSLRAPEVLLTKGEIREVQLDDPEGAAAIYEKILIDYPESLQVEEARRRIRKLESPGI